ncbi:PucR family transcriptional regulator [Bacillus marasmi]|uniref:PucR family transcriptional regulator n=1 Tax=Bacillus marasmi TaxID=1926279 RepID=UPI0011C8DF7E|nr:helix-turn-helix domain-containing protein [Bacillus marasmi]
MVEQYPIPDYVQELLAVSNQGARSILIKLSSLLSLHAYITDPLFQISFSSDHTFSVEEANIIEIQDRQVINGASFTCKISLQSKFQQGLACPIVHHDNTIGYIILLNNKDEDIPMYADLLNFVASLCGIHLQKRIEMMQEKSKFKEAFLFNLLFGNMKQKEEIIEYGDIWGWDFRLPHIAVVFSLLDADHFINDHQMLQTILLKVEKTLLQKNIKPISLIRHNQVTVLLPVSNPNFALFRKDLESLSTAILNDTSSYIGDKQLACGFGKVYKNPTELFRSFQEAKVAFELGILINIKLPFFSDLGLERILYKHDLQDLKEYYENILGALLEYDAANGTNFLETLEAFSSNQFDMTKTSTALFLHRNTLRYRLKKVEEILNIKLDDVNNRLNISAAFKIKLLRKLT